VKRKFTLKNIKKTIKNRKLGGGDVVSQLGGGVFFTPLGGCKNIIRSDPDTSNKSLQLSDFTPADDTDFKIEAI